MRRLRREAKPGDAILVEDETLLRLFPPLRQAWAKKGRQAVVPISGLNARRVLFGAINIRTGRRLLQRARSWRQQEFQVFLQRLRRAYKRRRIWLVLDIHGGHTARASRRLARQIGIHLLWLPRQSPELNPMDSLWREGKRLVSANRQFATIDEHADQMEAWLLGLSSPQARRKAGILSKNFWLLT